MLGIFLFIVLPLFVMVLVAFFVAVLAGSSKDDGDRRGGMGNNFIDWML